MKTITLKTITLITLLLFFAGCHQTAEQYIETTPNLPKTYTVRPGDTMFQIAQRIYGDGHYWRHIKEANPDKVSPEGGITIGIKLRIPELPANE